MKFKYNIYISLILQMKYPKFRHITTKIEIMLHFEDNIQQKQKFSYSANGCFNTISNKIKEPKICKFLCTTCVFWLFLHSKKILPFIAFFNCQIQGFGAIIFDFGAISLLLAQKPLTNLK